MKFRVTWCFVLKITACLSRNEICHHIFLIFHYNFRNVEAFDLNEKIWKNLGFFLLLSIPFSWRSVPVAIKYHCSNCKVTSSQVNLFKGSQSQLRFMMSFSTQKAELQQNLREPHWSQILVRRFRYPVCKRNKHSY